MPIDTSNIPNIDFPWPPCPMCGIPLDLDAPGHPDGWHCGNCQVNWPRTGMDPQPDNENAEVCGAPCPERYLGGYIPANLTCLLAAGNHARHAGAGEHSEWWHRWDANTGEWFV